MFCIAISFYFPFNLFCALSTFCITQYINLSCICNFLLFSPFFSPILTFYLPFFCIAFPLNDNATPFCCPSCVSLFVFFVYIFPSLQPLCLLDPLPRPLTFPSLPLSPPSPPLPPSHLYSLLSFPPSCLSPSTSISSHLFFTSTSSSVFFLFVSLFLFLYLLYLFFIVCFFLPFFQSSAFPF